MKILKFTLFTFLFILINTNIVYAKDSLPNFSDYIKQNDGSEKYYFVRCDGYHSDDRIYYLYIYSDRVSPTVLQDTEWYHTYSRPQHQLTYGVDVSVYSYDIKNDDTWTHLYTGDGSGYSCMFGVPLDDFKGVQDSILLYANYDIEYNYETVFHKAPTLRGAIVPRMKIMEYFLQSLKLYLPSLIVFLLSVIGFYKAWNFLKTQLLN